MPDKDELADLQAQAFMMANEQVCSSGYAHLYSLKFTKERTRTYIIQRTHWTLNRRDCWAQAQALAPMDVKKKIWDHERDELEGRPEDGIDDHYTLSVKEGGLLGLTPDDFITTPPCDGLVTCSYAWLQLASQSPWLTSLAACAALELSNSDEILKDGSNSRRIGEIMNRDLGIPLKAQASNAEHAVADVKHAHILMEIAEDHMHTAQDMEQILDGLRKSWAIDRVWKTVLSDMMAALPAS